MTTNSELLEDLESAINSVLQQHNRNIASINLKKQNAMYETLNIRIIDETQTSESNKHLINYLTQYAERHNIEFKEELKQKIKREEFVIIDGTKYGLIQLLPKNKKYTIGISDLSSNTWLKVKPSYFLTKAQ